MPQGTPAGLIPFMVLIERVRRVIRPGTLAVRLAANIIAGHLLLTLLRRAITPGRPTRVIFVGGRQLLLLLLESAVAAIQAYVFSILSTLYAREVYDKPRLPPVSFGPR